MLRHELGHILGLVHEDDRTDGIDATPSLLRADTPFLNKKDPHSVMRRAIPHTRDEDWCLSETDKALARYLYGLPDPSEPAVGMAD